MTPAAGAGAAAGHSGTCCHPPPPDKTLAFLSARSDTIAARCGLNKQVTNLNGARIFRVVQQPDRAVVFPLKIPDAATHKSAQHLSLPGFAALRLQDQNNKLEHQHASECHIDRISRSPERPAATDSAAEASTIVVPLSFPCCGPVLRAKSKDARIQIQRLLSPAALCVCLCRAEDYLSPFTAAT